MLDRLHQTPEALLDDGGRDAIHPGRVAVVQLHSSVPDLVPLHAPERKVLEVGGGNVTVLLEIQFRVLEGFLEG